MKIHSPKKVLKRISIVSLVIVTVAFLYVIFTIKYRINTVLKEYVRQETQGAYQLDISKTSLNLLKGRVMVKGIRLKPSGNAGTKPNYQLKIADLYLSLASWKQLLFHHKLYVDSFRINQPYFTIFRPKEEKDNTAWRQIQDIFSSLKHISETFKVHVMEINHGNIGISNKKDEEASPSIKNIYFRIENFGQKTKEQVKLRYSDDVVLYMPRQRWTFASGHSISFKKLTFSGKDQLLKVDSCYLTKAATNTKAAASLFADQLILKANGLSSVFEKDELNIDSLYFKSPVLSFTFPSDRSDKDTTSRLNESVHQLLGNIKVRFIHIENGRIQSNTSGGRSYTSRKTNLSINYLDINHDRSPQIQTGSIDLHLDGVSFASRDSLYVLMIKKFGLEGRNLICSDAVLKPFHKKGGELSWIKLPKFTLVDFNLQGLVEKNLKAQSAVIEQPQVRFDARTTRKKGMEPGIPVDKFYETLNDIDQVIDVHWLTVKNGAFEYHAPLPEKAGLSIKDVNAEINLDAFLGSSSLLATKESINGINIGSIVLNNNGTRIVLENFFANGNKQRGILKTASIDLPSGNTLQGENISWENFSWEHFVKDKRIDIDSMNIGQLYVTSSSPQYDKTVAPSQKVIMPYINIKKLNIGNSDIEVNKNQLRFKAKANNISAAGLSVAHNEVSWTGLNGVFKDISLSKDSSQVTIRQIIASDKRESNAADVTYSDLKNLVKIPIIKFKLNYSSSGSRSVVPFSIQKLEITDGFFRYESARKPFSITGGFNISAESVSTGDKNASALFFDKVKLDFDSLRMKTENVPVFLNKLELLVSKGSLSGMDKPAPMLTGFLNAQWKSLQLRKPIQDGFFEIADCSGRVKDFSLHMSAREKNYSLENIIDRMSLTGGRFFYANDAISASISNISGSVNEEGIELKGIEIKPKATLKSFLKTSPWQKDYLTFNCDRVVLKNIDTRAFLEDTSLMVRSVYLQNPRISSYRDKNIAFQHGIEKLMPTKLIAGIKTPVQIDTVHISGAFINVHEISQVTKREGIVPLKGIDALFKNVTNRPEDKDSLIINITGRVLDYNIRKFRYAESYNDPLSGFRMNYSISPMYLPSLTEVTNPLTAVEVTRGYADTLYATITGNKYATFGEMNFYYHNLRVRILNKKDVLKKNVFLGFETFIANSILIKSNNNKQASLFFVRDREKFIFNYWVKTLFSGLFASTGAKRNNKYIKMYNKLAEKYSLPAAEAPLSTSNK